MAELSDLEDLYVLNISAITVAVEVALKPLDSCTWKQYTFQSNMLQENKLKTNTRVVRDLKALTTF